MKSLLQIALILLCSSAASLAQVQKPGITIGAGAFYANPKGAFKDLYKGGIGAEVKGGIGIGNTFIMATLGYAAFAAQSTHNSGTLTYAPIKVGVKQYFLAKRLFVNGDVGSAKINDKTMNAAERNICADVGAGFRLFGLEAGLYYEVWKNPSAFRNNYSTSVLYKVGYNISL